MAVYYNEFDPFAAQWLRNLIATGHIAPGDVDERSIVDVRPDDLRGYTQWHFFAGIGVWSHALRAVGWADDRPVWTASMPCQPFSAAGKQQGHADERHLAPVWLRLVSECRPPVAIGEQVGAAVGMGWLDALFIQMEQNGYACGAVTFPACSVGAPHIRQRLYWVAQSNSVRLEEYELLHTDLSWRSSPTDGMADAAGAGADGGLGCEGGSRNARWPESARGGGVGLLAHSAQRGLGIDGSVPGSAGYAAQREPVGTMGNSEDFGYSSWENDRREGSPDKRERSVRDQSVGSGAVGGIMGDAKVNGRERRSIRATSGMPQDRTSQASPLNGFWADAQWLPCRDGKERPVEPGTLPLVDGATQRVGRLRAYGNAIVGPQAQAFIESVMDCRP